ncbi:MAG: phosphoglycerate dehydrogenase [Spirochaetaceae bacterium]|jgi:D-3-phosphoglycerate dehydrogenase|nr:phosphoglycerate dehydrogenase [Spirochaetaceae bacterium]
MNTYTIICAAHSFTEPDATVIGELTEAGHRVLLPKTIEELTAMLPEADGIIAGQQPYTADMMRSAKKLKVISVYGVGCDKIDLSFAHQVGIVVTNTPGANNESVADLAIALMLAAARRIPEMDALIREGRTTRLVGIEMAGATLGVIGTGRIGKGVIRRSHGFDMGLLCYDAYPDEEYVKIYGGKYVDMDTLLRESDFITIHAPLTDKTRNLIGEGEFKKMKPRAIIVNTARGGIIDEDALYRALTTGEIAAAGLDTTVGFVKDSPLRQLPNCVLLPHAGASTFTSLERMARFSVRNLLEVLGTGSCKARVN